jgi:hypothetical protein
MDGMLVSLQRQFMSTQVIGLAVGNRRGGMSVGGQIMQFYDSIVGARGHCFLLAD